MTTLPKLKSIQARYLPSLLARYSHAGLPRVATMSSAETEAPMHSCAGEAQQGGYNVGAQLLQQGKVVSLCAVGAEVGKVSPWGRGIKSSPLPSRRR